MSGALGLALVLAMIAANGVFVAIEFALVSLRRPMVEQLAAGGDRRARAVSRELSELSYALSSAQFGITATSLVVGYVAEQAVGDTLIRPVLELLGVPEQATLAVTVTGAFLLSTVVQMVFGELFPKNLAISRPLPVALALAPATRGFGIVFGPVIRVFDGAARRLTQRVFRVEVRDELEGGHTLDELARIIAVSGEEGSLSELQTVLLRRAVELGDRRVGEVMIARPDVAWLEHDATLTDLREAARATGYSRFPIRGDRDDEVLGSVHIKDLLTVEVAAYDTTTVEQLAAPALAVPESAPLRRLLADLRRERRTFAVAVDEYGDIAGIVTVEDVLERLVGDIEDEYDRTTLVVRSDEAGGYVVRGSLHVDRAEGLLGCELPDGDYETLAGFVLDRLGHIPEPGEVVEHDDLVVTVLAVDGVRITELSLARSAPRDDAGGAS